MITRKKHVIKCIAHPEKLPGSLEQRRGGGPVALEAEGQDAGGGEVDGLLVQALCLLFPVAQVHGEMLGSTAPGEGSCWEANY